VQPISAVVPAHFAMLAGNEAAGVGQGPIKVLVAPMSRPALALYSTRFSGPPSRQARLVLDSKRQAIGDFFMWSINLAVDP